MQFPTDTHPPKEANLNVRPGQPQTIESSQQAQGTPAEGHVEKEDFDGEGSYFGCGGGFFWI